MNVQVGFALLMLIPISMALENITPDEIVMNSDNLLQREAKEEFNNVENLTECNESNSTYWYNKALELQGDEAIEAYNRAISLNQSYIDAWYEKAYVLWTMGYDNETKYDEAIEAYFEVIKLDPKNVSSMNNAAYLLKLRDRSNESLDLLNASLKIDPQNGETWFAKANALTGLEAIYAYDNAIEFLLENNSMEQYAYENKFIVLMNLGKTDKANETLKSMIKVNPLDWSKWDSAERLQKQYVEKTYYPRDFFTMIDGKGVTFFLSFVDKESGEYATPEGKLLISLYKSKSASSSICSKIYEIKRNSYDLYQGGIAIKKWISFEEMTSMYKTPSNVFGRFAFQDVHSVVSADKEET